MSANPAQLTLAIDSPLATPDAVNYRPPSWPPAPDWPVMVDINGEVISRWGDSIWRLDPWAGMALTLNFGDGRVINSDPIDTANADLLRIVTGWWIWGTNGVRTVRNLLLRFGGLRPLFALCSREGILASDLMRFPLVADRLPEVLPPSRAGDIMRLLHALYERRDTLGFTLLNREGMTRLEGTLPEHEARQTPYIPPRIWRYQVGRLRECLDDFLAHRSQIEDCFRFCLDAYARNHGSLAAAFPGVGRTSWVTPFTWRKNDNTGRLYHGPFALTAERFGIVELLTRWVEERVKTTGRPSITINSLSDYMTLVSRASLAYLLNHSLMRIEEGWNLRADCLQIERDSQFGDIYTLRGVTTKTQEEDDALWITSPSAKVAVEAMTIISHLRMMCAEANPLVPISLEDRCNPYFQTYLYEPWATRGCVNYRIRPKYVAYREIVETYPKLFNKDELRITQQDLDLARLVTPTLNADEFSVGEVWPLAWHQLRRTGAVNMQASGLVSDPSLQFQLKHATRAMSLYYGRGYSRVRLNAAAETYYLRALYETLGKELARMATMRYISPHGEMRKAEIVRLIDPADAKKLTKLAKNGSVMCREILLGYCTNREPCPYGGIDSIAHCGGGDAVGDAKPCPDVLYDREKASQVKALDRYLDERLAGAPSDSPLRSSLEAQKRSARNFLDVIEAN